MATKVVRECDRLGCAIDSKPFSPGEALPPAFETTGYTVLRTVTDKKGVTTTETVLDFDEVCTDCASDIEDLILRIKGEKVTRKPRKAAAEASAPKRRGRPPKVKEPVEEAAPAAPVEAAEDVEVVVAAEEPAEPPKRKRGRPKGSKNKPKTPPVEAAAPEPEPAPEPTPAPEPEEEAAVEEPLAADVVAQLKDKVDAAVAKGVEDFQKDREEAAAAAEPEPAEVEEPSPEEEVETFETDSGDIVNAETGDVIATREEGEEKDEEVVASSNGMESAHPF